MTASQQQGKDTDHWDRYWASPRIAACLEGADSGYGADILAPWKAFFSRLPRGARVLDIGTGNGAIALTAQRISDRESLDFDITGVDSADINPRLVLEEQEIDAHSIGFLGKTDASELPFEDASYDAVCSQYALEYMDTGAVLPELSRVTTPGGRVQLVLHASPGVAEKAAAAELSLVNFLQQELDIIGLARKTLGFVTDLERRGRTPSAAEDARARALIGRFEAALERLRQQIEATRGNPMLKNTMGLLVQAYQQRQHFDIEHLQASIAALEQEIDAHAARLEELRAAALDESGLQRLCSRLEDAGFADLDTDVVIRRDDGASLGWLLNAARC